MDRFDVIDEDSNSALMECLDCECTFTYYKDSSIYVECPYCKNVEIFS